MVKWIGVEGQDVERDGEFGFNVLLEAIAAHPNAAERRAQAAVSVRFPKTLGNTEPVSSVEIGDTAIPMMNRYRVTVFVPTEGLRDAGAGTPINTLLQAVDDRVVDPITGEFMEN